VGDRERGNHVAVALRALDIGDALPTPAGHAVFIGRGALAVAVGRDRQDELLIRPELLEARRRLARLGRRGLLSLAVLPFALLPFALLLLALGPGLAAALRPLPALAVAVAVAALGIGVAQIGLALGRIRIDVMQDAQRDHLVALAE